MTPGEFFADRLGRIVLQLASVAVACAFLLATGTRRGVLVILLIGWGLAFVTVQLCDFFRYRGRLRELEAVMEGLDQKHLFAECAPRPRSAYERRLFALLRRSGKAMIEAVSNARWAQREYQEYVQSWVHEIKTPITAAQLICRSAGPEIRRKLACEIAQIDNHVERALFYARAQSPEKDFLIRETGLADLAAEAIQRHRSLMIQSGVRIETEGLDCAVYTDGKWVCFMLGQFLQNAVRYRSEAPVITLSARQLGGLVELTVEDNGIGIPPHELPRIFERGFTGSNGRSRGGSTGMGLYLCRRLAASLAIDLRVRSEEGRGTSVILTFPARESCKTVR